jgi:hypothetical protein
VYVILDAHTMNEAAADALLQDLEEPRVRRHRADRRRPRAAAGDDPFALPAVRSAGSRGGGTRRAPAACARARRRRGCGDHASRRRPPRQARAAARSRGRNRRDVLLDVARSVYAADASTR